MVSNCSKFTCKECNKKFTLKTNLYAHMRKFHNCTGVNDPVPKTVNELCYICGKSFMKTANFNRHMKNSHTTTVATKRLGRIQCSECGVKFRLYRELREHLTRLHNWTLENEECIFNSESEFLKWKDLVQQKSLSHFVLDTSATILCDGGKKMYYNCHRSHQYKSSGKNIRSAKGVISNKCGTACPSRMEVLVKGGIYKTSFWKTHVGHAIDIGTSFLSKEVRTEIAGM
ncbi:hypothetical protein RI129_007006 [Pyrocoelia pectoralis]|uniref:C2H2-type domain-containing protein n=1 Tax=Pyrocoelia pectoralis TaxID=417401 RepID=A0AAN7ZM39_9COLE